MSKIKAFFAVFFLNLFIFSFSFGQQNKLINSGAIMQQGLELQSEGKFKEAIALYKDVSRSDTNYSDLLEELAICSYNDSAYEESKQYALTGLQLFPEKRNLWYNYLANTVDELGNKDEALQYYDDILKANPNDYTAMYNKGICYYNQKKYAPAQDCFQKTILIYPYYTSAHYFLALINLDQGNLPQAMLSFATVFVLDPEYKRSKYAIDFLTDIANIKDYTLEKKGADIALASNTFSQQQEILETKAALDNQYKLKTDVDDPIIRQLQVLLEKLEYDQNSKDFWMQVYVPFYQQIFQDNQFNALVNYMFSGLEIKSVQAFNKKNKKEIDKFKEFADSYLREIRETQTLNAAARKKTDQKFLYDKKQVSGKGAWKLNDNSEQLLTGPWEFYYSNGNLKSKGVLSESEDKEGIWEFYYSNGALKEKSFFKNNEAEGLSEQYWDNGLLQAEENYMKGQLNGICKYYYYNGVLRRATSYKDDQKDGPSQGYTSKGFADYTVNFKEGKEEGELKYFHPNGKIASTTFFTNDIANGSFKKYDEQGVLIQEGTYTDDQQTGIWKSYFPSGKIKTESVYTNGELNGIYNEYFDNGQLSYTVPYSKGKAEGKELDYGEDGKLYSEAIFEKGRMKEVSFFDKTGKTISNGSTRNGAGNFIYYDEFGNKNSEGAFTKEGWRDGITYYYFLDGKTKIKADYKEGALNGEKIIYYRSGQISETINFTNDKEDGYYTSYYENGKVKTEGWYVDGQQQGSFLYYDLMGNLSSRIYFLNDVQHGYAEYYFPNGKKDYEELYDNGWIKHITQFDSSGTIVLDTDIPKGNADFLFKNNNGKTYIKGRYHNYNLEGPYELSYFNGTPNIIRNYKSGLRDSSFKQYFFGGTLSTEGYYSRGNIDGTWKYYHENGKLERTESYVNGNQNGKSIIYNDDGTLDKETNYKDGMLEGECLIYGDNNQPAIKLNYHNDILISYTYQNKEGKYIPPIALRNGTGLLTAYYKNGNKSAEINFVESAVTGIRKLYFSDGKPYLDGVRNSGYEQGVKKIYDPNGQLVAEENYYFGNLNGLINYYYPSGKIKSEENWYNGTQHGISKYFKEDGKLKETRQYYYGLLQTVN